MNKFSTLNGAQYFFRDISRLFSIMPAEKYVKHFTVVLIFELGCGNLMKCQ